MDDIDLIIAYQRKIMRHLNIMDDLKPYEFNALATVTNLSRFNPINKTKDEIIEVHQKNLKEESESIKKSITEKSNSIIHLLNAPMAKFEGMLLFIGGIFGNILVSGLTPNNGESWLNNTTYTGGGLILITFWILSIFYRRK